MREIKFRAWSLINNPPSMIQITSGLISDLKTIKGQWYVMQYTGLKDKNGVEIYSGDIVADYDADGIHVVEYHEDCFCLVRYSWSEARDLKRRSPSESEWWDTLEVIGNIYENKELLE